MRFLRRVIVASVLLLLGLLAVIAVNQEPVRLRFLFWETPEWSVFWWLLAAFVLGGLLGHVLALLSTLPLRMENRRLLKSQQSTADRTAGST